MKLFSLLIVASSFPSVYSRPPTIQCFVGHGDNYHLESGFTSCKSHHTSHHTLHLSGHHGSETTARALLYEEFMAERTRGCSLEIDNERRIDMKCKCITDKCNDPATLNDQLHHAFVEILEGQKQF